MKIFIHITGGGGAFMLSVVVGGGGALMLSTATIGGGGALMWSMMWGFRASEFMR